MIEEDEEPYDPFEELEQEEISLPLIKASVIGDRQRFRKMKSPPNKRKNDPESLFIYKDFDTSLTAVKGPLKSLAKIEQRTAQRGSDMIRDRLLSFDVRDGNFLRGRSERTGPATMNERSHALQ